MSKMSFKEFTQEVAGKIREFLPETFAGADIELKVVTKNNNLKLTGLTIHESGSRICPTIYLEQFYQNYMDGENMEAVLKKIADFRVINEGPKDFDADCIKDYEYVRTRLVPRLVSKDLNTEVLSERPHKIMEDLAVQYYVVLGVDENGTAGVAVTNNLMEIWGVSKEEVHEAAISNIPTIDRSTCRPLSEVLSGMMGADMSDLLPDDCGIYVLSNTSQVYGAASILDHDFMVHVCEMFAEKDGSDPESVELVVIPSSVHECLLFSKNAGAVSSAGLTNLALSQIIEEVNTSTVSLEERLSTHPYCYSINEGLKSVV